MVYKLLVCVSVFFSLFLSFSSSAQEPLSSDTLIHRLWRQTQLYPQEKIYVRTDRQAYVAGDTIRFSVQVVNSISHQPEGVSRYAYVELYKEDSLMGRIKAIGDTLGVMSGYIPLDKEFEEGSYQLRAYTRYSAFQREPSVFTRQLMVLSYNGVNHSRFDLVDAGFVASDNISEYTVSFYPEGGQVVAGALCRFGFEAVNSDGFADQVSGWIVDSRRDTLLQFRSLHEGMGEFSFIPRHGEEYEAVCINQNGQVKTFKLPLAKEGALSLSIESVENAFHVNLLHDSLYHDSSSRLQLLVLQRGFPLYADSWKGEMLVFSKTMFREGTLNFLLLDRGLIVSERSTFVFPDKKKIQCLITDNADNNAMQDPTRLELIMLDKEGRPLNGVCSIAITYKGDLLPDSSVTIQTGLLLSPDLQGSVYDPGWYFRNAHTPEGKVAMDLLMLVRGWRRYDIEPAMRGEYDEPVVLPELSSQISGRVYDRKGKGLTNSVVTLADPRMGILEQTTSTEDGRFIFTGFEVPEGTRFVVSAKTSAGKDNVHLSFDEEPFRFKDVPNPQGVFVEQSRRSNSVDVWLGYRNRTIEKLITEEDVRHIYLDEIEVSAPKKTYNTEYEKLAKTVITEERIRQSGLPNLRLLLRALGGINLDAGGRNPLLVFDGIPVYDTGGGTKDFLLYYLPVEDIGRIDIIKGVHALGYFNGKNNMIVAVSTKRGGKGVTHYEKTNTGYITPLGYQQPIEQYAPVPTTSNLHPISSAHDLRSVLYWQPRLLVEEGKATIDFYPPLDSPVSFVIEGVTLEGELIYFSW